MIESCWVTSQENRIVEDNFNWFISFSSLMYWRHKRINPTTQWRRKNPIERNKFLEGSVYLLIDFLPLVGVINVKPPVFSLERIQMNSICLWVGFLLGRKKDKENESNNFAYSIGSRRLERRLPRDQRCLYELRLQMSNRSGQRFQRARSWWSHEVNTKEQS